MSPDALDVRRAVAEYLADIRSLERLHETAASAFSAIAIDGGPDAELVNRAFGLLTDRHAGLIGEDELRDALRPMVTSYASVWSLMALPLQVTTGTSGVTTPPVPVQRPSLRFFDRSPEAVSA